MANINLTFYRKSEAKMLDHEEIEQSFLSLLPQLQLNSARAFIRFVCLFRF